MGRSPTYSVIVNEDGVGFDTFGEVETVEIANGEALSGEIDKRGSWGALRIFMPNAWTAADIGFKGASSSGGTFNPLYDEDGNRLEVSVAANRVIRVSLEYLIGVPYLKLWSQNAGSDENQGAARSIVVSKL